MFNKFATVRVVGGRFNDKLKGQRGEVDTSMEDGSCVVTFRQGHGDDAKQESYLLASASLAGAKVVEKPAAERRAEIEKSIGLRSDLEYV
jgi:predicted methyltransferase MtxX (methanogen marker protein 4)